MTPEKVVRNQKMALAGLLGLALGYGIAVRYLPGGYDAWTFYLRAPFPGTTAPGWVYLFTYPLAQLGWPLGWQGLVFLSVLAAGGAAWRLGNRYWWGVLVSAPFFWDVWLGQIELLPIVGMWLTAEICLGRLSPAWLGLSWLALLAKPQVGLGALVVQALCWFQGHRPGWPSLGRAALLFSGGVGLSLVLWPWWPPQWLATLRTFQATWWNAALWPWGALLWLPSLYLAWRADLKRRLRLLLSASLLGSPYFALYHATTLLTVVEDWPTVLFSWLIIPLGMGLPGPWMRWGWLLPLWVWLGNAAASLRSRPSSPVSSHN